MVHLPVEYYLDIKKKEILPCDSMDRRGDYYAKLSKPGRERQISYDLAYMQNVKNKINEQTKQKLTHIYSEQTHGY